MAVSIANTYTVLSFLRIYDPLTKRHLDMYTGNIMKETDIHKLPAWVALPGIF